jgi:hypothetical protein
MIDEMGEQICQKQDCNSDHPEQKMLGQFWGVDFLFVHGDKDTPKGYAMDWEKAFRPLTQR